MDKTIGVVGTRKPTHYGQQMVTQLIESCAEIQPVIISGMAMGIDGLAHRKALDLGLPSIALVAHGLGHAYPAGHRHLKKRLESAGGVLTEHPWDSLVEKGFFPMRNRLIAALSDVLVVVETKAKGGSMITVNQALNYRKPVMAVPGRHIDPYSAGCNELIRDKKAEMLLHGNDLLALMQWRGSALPRAVQQELFAALDEHQLQIVQLLKEQPGKGLDQLLVQQPLAFSELSVALFELEYKGIIRTLPGNRYTLV
jgi:DNA processing protein